VQEQFAALDGQPNEHPSATGSPPNRNGDSSNPFTSASEWIRNRMWPVCTTNSYRNFRLFFSTKLKKNPN